MQNGFIIFLIIMLINIIKINAQDDEFFEPKATVASYGELHYNHEKVESKSPKNVLDFHRFVMFFGYNWTEKWSFKSEVELEHNFVEEGQGELALEQAFINYQHSEWLGFQAGVILTPVGQLNEYHEPPLFLSVERPEYNKYIIPTTWFGNGAAVYGNYENFNYRIAVMEGLNSDKFSAKSGIRSGRQIGFKAKADRLLYTGRVDYLGLPGLRAGVSFSYNKAMGDSTQIPFYLFETHIKYYAHNFYTVFELGNIGYSGSDVERSFGYYFDLGYNIGSFISESVQVIPFFRWTDYNTASSVKGGGISEEKYNFKKWMAGIAVKPLPQIVFKADYGIKTNQLSNADVTLFNIGMGYMF